MRSRYSESRRRSDCGAIRRSGKATVGNDGGQVKRRTRNVAAGRSRGTLRTNPMPLPLGSEHNVPLVQPYERFRAWHACDALVVAVYRATERFPRTELYGLTSQARRAAFSAAANIAEGSAKHGRREFRRYLDLAIRSLAELSYTLQLSRTLGLLSDTQWRELDRLRVDASRLTCALYE